MPIEVPDLPPQPADNEPFDARMRWTELAMQRALVLATIESAAATDRHAQVGSRMAALMEQGGHADNTREVLSSLLAETQGDPDAIAAAVRKRLDAVDTMLGTQPPAPTP